VKQRVFRSRISVLIIGIFLGVYLLLFPISVHLFHDKLYGTLCVIWGTIFVIPLLIFVGTRYIISGYILYLKIWFIPVGSFRIKDIVSVERSYNLLSAPAASLKRLCIRIEHSENYLNKPNFWLISPVKEKEFIKDLISIDPHIHINVPVEKGIWRFWDWDI